MRGVGWRTNRGKGVTSYSTPIIVDSPQGPEIIVNSSEGIEAYYPGTGERLWQIDGPNRFPIPVAVHDQGMLYTSRGYRSGPYMAIRAGGRGDVSKSHVASYTETGAPYVSSLVHYNGLLYMANGMGIVRRRQDRRAVVAGTPGRHLHGIPGGRGRQDLWRGGAVVRCRRNRYRGIGEES